MERVSLDDLEPTGLGGDTCRIELTDALGTTDVAINRYRVPAGEGLPAGLHAHMDQEELFLVLEGEATFETLDGAVTVRAGEAVRFAPGEFQSGQNAVSEPGSDGSADECRETGGGGSDELVLLALGAPRGSEDIRIPVDCPDCGFGNLRVDWDDTEVRLVCPDCDAAHRPSDCPACGHDDLRVTLGDGGDTVVVCAGCGARYEAPPLED